MRICYLTNEYPIEGKHAGGIATYLKTIAETLVQQGHQVDVVYCHHRLSIQKVLQINNVNVHLVPSTETVNALFYRILSRQYFGLLRRLKVHGDLTGYLAISLCLADYIEKNIKADVFECQEIGFLAFFLCMDRKNVVIKLHTPFAYVARLNRIFSLKYAFIEYFERKTVAMSTSISSPSASLARKLSRRWMLRTQVTVEHLPFRLSQVEEDDSAVPPFKYVLYFGRIEIRKGVLLLAKAIRRLQSHSPDITFLFVGADTNYGRKENKSVKEKMLRILGPAVSRVSFMEARKHEQLYPLIRNAEFVVLPSLWENFPYVCLESMALGKTVIAPSETGFAEQFEDNRSGILFKRRDYRDLARKIAYCLENPERVHEIGRAAQEKIKDFDAAKMTQGMLKKYHEAIGRTYSSPVLEKTPRKIRWFGRDLFIRVLRHRDAASEIALPVSTFDEDQGPQVSVIVPSFNEEEKIRGSITSLLQQETGTSYEVIVVDSSMDDTPNIILQNFPTVVLVSSKHRLTCGEAKNVGLSLARGQKILFTDADIRVPKDWVDRMAKRLDEFDGVGGPFLNGTPESVTGTLGYCLEFFRILPKKTPDTNARFLTGGNSGFRREAISGKKFMSGIGEDIAFNFELVKDGKRLLYDPTLGVRHLNRVGFKKVLDYHVALGRGGYRYRKRLNFGSPIMKAPILAFLVPPAIVPFVTYKLFTNKDYWDAFLLLTFSPLAMLIYSCWSYGFYRESRDSRKAPPAR
jgi:glycosyltransferase involved in cell wall biosynthesis